MRRLIASTLYRFRRAIMNRRDPLRPVIEASAEKIRTARKSHKESLCAINAIRNARTERLRQEFGAR